MTPRTRAFLPGTMLALLLATTAYAQPVTRFADYDIYTYDGSTAQRTTFLDGTGEFNPDFGPFGFLLVHDVTRFEADGTTFQSQDLYLTNRLTGTSTPLPGGEGGNDAAWAPFGFLIAFDRAPFPAPTDPTLYLVPAWGGTPLALRTDAVDPAWSPTGRYLVFTQPSDGSVRALDLLDGSEALVAQQGYHPAWSPNGRYIAFAQGGDIYRVRVASDGTPLAAPQQLTTDPADDGQPSWTPGSRHLAFHSARSGDYDIWRIPAGGGTPTPVTGLTGPGDFDPSVAPFGNRVAYAGYTAPTTIASKAEPAREQTLLDPASLAAAPLDLAALAKRHDVSAWERALHGATLQEHYAAWVQRAVQTTAGASAEASLDAASVTLAATSYPNPFTPATTIRFTLPEAADASLVVYDILGREVAMLVDGPMEAGTHAVRFEAGHLPSGTYFYRLEVGSAHLVEQMTLIK